MTVRGESGVQEGVCRPVHSIVVTWSMNANSRWSGHRRRRNSTYVPVDSDGDTGILRLWKAFLSEAAHGEEQAPCHEIGRSRQFPTVERGQALAVLELARLHASDEAVPA